MKTQAEIRQDLVLVGGGHSHALALRMLAMKPIVGLRITLISPQSHTPYSGMLPGLIAGHYNFEQAHIDLAKLCQWAGVRFIQAEVSALDVTARSLSIAGRPAIFYDVVSLDVGSQPELDSVPGARQYVTPVKPVASLWQRWLALFERCKSEDPVRISVVGGGAGSVELALSMAFRLGDAASSIDLCCAGDSILEGYSKRARKAALAALHQFGVTVHCNSRVVEVQEQQLLFENGQAVAYDEVFWCTGAAAASWVAQTGLPVDELGFLQVEDTLQSTADPRVFGAGDIATQINHPRPKAGVYAVRQAPTLTRNLRAFLLGKPLSSHTPQQRFLSLISLGDKTAAAHKGIFSASGAWVWSWKNRIDRAFMHKFEQLPTMRARGNWGVLPELSVEQSAKQSAKHSPPPCGGCGAKIGASALSNALAALAQQYPQQVVGIGDDAALLPSMPGMALVQSVDVLRELVSDPWQMGRIAANHALSDLYACGAQPASALAMVTLPFAGSRILQRELEQVLAGALYEFEKVDCVLSGGHSMQGPEMNLGFVVNGHSADAGGIALSKTGAKAQDKLILTKPLGTGTVFAAHMQLAASSKSIQAATDSMLQSNAAAAQAALEQDVSACTDVTGFGLAGHLREMLPPGLCARLSLQDLPYFPGALQLLREGFYSSMHAANASSSSVSSSGTASSRVSVIDTSAIDSSAARLGLLFDPQTSGGLLLACADDQVEALLLSLKAAGYEHSAVIGEVYEDAHEVASARIVLKP